MKLTILGSGSCRVNQESRRPSGYYLQIQGQSMLIDTGTGITTNIPKTDISVREIDTIVSTHRHPDHISDLIPIIQEKVVNSFDTEETNIRLIGPKGHKDYIKDRMRHEMAETPESIKEKFGFNIKITELEANDHIKLGETLIKTLETDHGPENFLCLAVRVEGENNVVTFTGDTDYFSSLAEFSKSSDLLVTDCSKPNELKAEGHMTPEECGKIADKAEVKTLILSHLYPEIEDYDIVAQAEEEFDREVIKAKDLMTIDK